MLDILANVRLEVETVPALRNRLINPTGEKGGWGWITVGTAHTLDGVFTSGRWWLEFRTESTDPVPPRMWSAPFVVTPNAMPLADSQLGVSGVLASITGAAGAYVKITANFRDADGAVVSNVVSAQINPNPAARFSFVTQVPSTAVTAQVIVGVYVAGDAVPATDTVTLLEQLTVANASTAAAVTNLPYIANPNGWLNILSGSNSVNIVREPATAGTLTAIITDATLDPATSDALTYGRRIRCTAFTGTTWEPIFTGRIDSAQVRYEHDTNSSDVRTRITVTANENVQALAAAPAGKTVYDLQNVPQLLEGLPVPWNIAGQTGHAAHVGLVRTPARTGGSVLDELLSFAASGTPASPSTFSTTYRVWVTRDGVIRMAAHSGAVTRDPAYYYSSEPTAYTDPDLRVVAHDTGLDPDDVLNSVTYKAHVYNSGTAQWDATDHGPYENQASKAEYGARSAHWDIYRFTATDLSIITSRMASSVLAAHSGGQRVRGVGLHIDSPAKITEGHALVDMYRVVSVDGIEHRVERIEHNIVATNQGSAWLITLGVAPLNAYPSATN